MSKYLAEIGGSFWRHGPQAEFETIREARRWAEEFGATADSCTITDRHGKVVAIHSRDPSGDGSRWFHAAV